MTSTKIQNLSVWINLNDPNHNIQSCFSHPYGQVLIIDIWNFSIRTSFVICFLLFVILLYSTGCQRRLEYDSFDSTKLFTLSELYEIKTFRSLDEALKQPDSVYKLIIFGKELNRVPDEVYSFKYLNTLELSKNSLKTLPEYIGDMIYLQGLYLAENKFSDMPEQVYRLPNLRRLRLGENKFDFMPEKLLEMKSIEEIYFGRNQIWEIPDRLFDMLQLRVLKLDNNNISNLKTSISKLKNLEVINLKNNKIESIPFEELISLQKLRTLNLKGNKIPFQVLDSLRKAMPNTKIEY